MARGPSARVVLARSKLNDVERAVADGLSAVARRVIDETRIPDAPPLGEGLAWRGGYLTFVNGRKVDGWGLDGKQPRRPRGVPVARSGVTVIAGFGFPMRLREFGHVNARARPALTPAASATTPHAPEIVGSVVRPRLGRV